MNNIEHVLLEGCKQMKIKLSDKEATQLIDYLKLIIKWNQTYNLSAINNLLEGVNKHLLDSLSIVSYITNKPLLDIGSGAGLPGIIFAIIRPKLAVSVLDSRGKKCYFMQFVKTQLKLKNLTIINSRVENFNSKNCFAQITSRAFATVEKTLKLSRHLLCDDGYYLLMRGAYYDKKVVAGMLVTSHQLKVPHIKDTRFLLKIKKNHPASSIIY